ncbi:MAG: type II toxin-antitoxin system PemK/MazF family toxin [Bryobacterales bacterium]|nr:type II toxin-antitoxin system PemK/MazF family toxin [Bryobacterales bacterium]
MASFLRRCDVVWANLDPVIGHEQAGLRPVLVISDDILNRNSGTVIAMAITSKEPAAGFPLTFALSRRISGKQAWIKITQVRTLSTQRLGKTLGRIDDEDMATIMEGLNEVLGN